MEHMVDIREVMDLFELNRTLRSELEARTVKDAELMRLPACPACLRRALLTSLGGLYCSNRAMSARRGPAVI